MKRYQFALLLSAAVAMAAASADDLDWLKILEGVQGELKQVKIPPPEPTPPQCEAHGPQWKWPDSTPPTGASVCLQVDFSTHTHLIQGEWIRIVKMPTGFLVTPAIGPGEPPGRPHWRMSPPASAIPFQPNWYTLSGMPVQGGSHSVKTLHDYAVKVDETDNGMPKDVWILSDTDHHKCPTPDTCGTDPGGAHAKY